MPCRSMASRIEAWRSRRIASRSAPMRSAAGRVAERGRGVRRGGEGEHREEVVPVRVHGMGRVALVADRLGQEPEARIAAERLPRPLGAQRGDGVDGAQRVGPELAEERRVAGQARVLHDAPDELAVAVVLHGAVDAVAVDGARHAAVRELERRVPAQEVAELVGEAHLGEGSARQRRRRGSRSGGSSAGRAGCAAPRGSRGSRRATRAASPRRAPRRAGARSARAPRRARQRAAASASRASPQAAASARARPAGGGGVASKSGTATTTDSRAPGRRRQLEGQRALGEAERVVERARRRAGARRRAPRGLRPSERRRSRRAR